MTQITVDRAVIEQALEAYDVATTPLARDRQEVQRARAALRAALEAKQEPAAPVQRQPLTERQIQTASGASDVYWAQSKLFIIGMFRAAESAHNITAHTIITDPAAIRAAFEADVMGDYSE